MNDDDDDFDDDEDEDEDPREAELRAVTARVVDDLTGAATLFTALDVSNAVKAQVADARHREISPIVRDLFERKAMGAYKQTMIDVMAGGSKPAKAYLYHLPEASPDKYDDKMRNQLAARPQRKDRDVDPNAGIDASSTSAKVSVGKDGRARVPKKLLENAGIRGDRVLVRSDSAGPKLTIVAAGAVLAAPVDPLFAVPDLFFTPTEQGQPLNFDHPALLHVPRSLIDVFGSDPKLVAKIEGGSVVVTRA